MGVPGRDFRRPGTLFSCWSHTLAESTSNRVGYSGEREVVGLGIHSTAIIHEGAEIGRDVEIGPFTVIGPNVRIGNGCRIHHQVTIDGYTTLGEGCEVFPQAILGTRPQDLKFAGERTTLEIGKNNIFREMVTVHPGTGNGGGVTRIGDRNLFLIGVHIAHDCQVGNHCVFANYVQLAGHVHVENNVNMGGHSAVHHFVTIGKHAFIGGMTRVAADVPPFVVMVAARGTRSEVRMINGVGLKRCGYSEEDIAALKEAFMRLFSRRARQSGTAISDRTQALLSEPGLNAHVRYLCECLTRSFSEGRHGRYLESLRMDPVHRATWKPQSSFTLTIRVEGKGSVQRVVAPAPDKVCEVLELTAKAEPGWMFAAWNGNLSSNRNPESIVLDRNMTVAATFVPHS